MDIYGYLWIYLWISMDTYGYLWILMNIYGYLRISGQWFPWPLVGGYVWHRVLIRCKRQVELSLQCNLTEGKHLIHVNTMSFFQFHTLLKLFQDLQVWLQKQMIEMRDKVNTYDHDLPSRAQLNKKGRHEIKRPSILRICTATTTSARALRELPSHDDWEFQSSNWRPNMLPCFGSKMQQALGNLQYS